MVWDPRVLGTTAAVRGFRLFTVYVCLVSIWSQNPSPLDRSWFWCSGNTLRIKQETPYTIQFLKLWVICLTISDFGVIRSQTAGFSYRLSIFFFANQKNSHFGLAGNRGDGSVPALDGTRQEASLGPLIWYPQLEVYAKRLLTPGAAGGRPQGKRRGSAVSKRLEADFTAHTSQKCLWRHH